jgi:hypothetical protein
MKRGRQKAEDAATRRHGDTAEDSSFPGSASPIRARVLLLVFCFLLLPSPARAHKLEAEATLGPFWQIQIESWFSTRDVPAGAAVKVYRQDDTVLIEGELDRDGFFTFTYRDAAPLRVVVSAAAGHRAEIKIGADELRKNAIRTAALCLAPPPSLIQGPLLAPMPAGAAGTNVSLTPSSRRDSGPPIGNLLIGVAILVLVAGAAVIIRRARQASQQGHSPGTDAPGPHL